MKPLNFTLIFELLFLFIIINSNSFTQTDPVMYFCERYDEYEGEVGIGNRFLTGAVTIMVIGDLPFNLSRVTIQYDKYDFKKGKFYYYKKASFEIEKEKIYLSFYMNDEINMQFDETGFYRVFLLDEDDRTVASALIEIIR